MLRFLACSDLIRDPQGPIAVPSTKCNARVDPAPVCSLSRRPVTHLKSLRNTSAIMVFFVPFMSIVVDVLAAYNRLLSDNPLLAQTLTTSAFCGIGDLMAQTRSVWREKASYDWKRTSKFLLKGIGCGIIWSHWFVIADLWSQSFTMWSMQVAKIPIDNLKAFAILRTIASLLLEQFVACPIIYGLWDLPILSIMNGEPLRNIPGIVRYKLLTLLVANAKLWTIVNVLIYNVPLKFRVLVWSMADLVWESFVSSIANNSQSKLAMNDEEEGILLLSKRDDVERHSTADDYQETESLRRRETTR